MGDPEDVRRACKPATGVSPEALKVCAQRRGLDRFIASGRGRLVVVARELSGKAARRSSRAGGAPQIVSWTTELEASRFASRHTDGSQVVSVVDESCHLLAVVASDIHSSTSARSAVRYRVDGACCARTPVAPYLVSAREPYQALAKLAHRDRARKMGPSLAAGRQRCRLRVSTIRLILARKSAAYPRCRCEWSPPQ